MVVLADRPGKPRSPEASEIAGRGWLQTNGGFDLGITFGDS
jgi:hypothetical protein